MMDHPASQKMMAHEDLQRSGPLERSSDRSFGLVFAGALAVVAIWPVLHGETLRWWAVGLSAALAAVALVKPALLSGANVLWARLGVLLGNVVGPVATAVLFYGMFVPLGILMRLTGKDPLRLRPDTGAKTYWIQRVPPGPPRDSLTNQF